MRHASIALCALPLASCAAFSESARPDYPQSAAEAFSGYNYVPLDPLPVWTFIDKSCDGKTPPTTLASLPDNAVRIAIRRLSGKGSASFGPAQLGVEGNSYQVILDYINADVSNLRFKYSGGNLVEGEAPASLTRVPDSSAPVSGNEIVIPVYVGVGLRLTANVTVRKGSVNLASLGALAAAAEAERATGSLIVQTLGITGKQVTSTLPMPSELNPTTIQNALQALGAVKAMVHNEDSLVKPRVTGILCPSTISRLSTLLFRNLPVSQSAGGSPASKWRCKAENEKGWRGYSLGHCRASSGGRRVGRAVPRN